MVVHFFTKGDKTAGSSRLRAFFVAQFLERDGVLTVVHDPSVVSVSETRWPKKFFMLVRYLRILRTVKRGDVIFLQRTIYNKYFLVLIVLYRLIFRRKMIFDFDDAVYLHSPFRTKLLCFISDAVIVAYFSSEAWVKKYNKNVHMIPTSIPFEIYAQEKKDYKHSNEPWIIGWIGNGMDQYVNLQLLGPVFKKLKEQNIDFVFRIVGSLQYKPLHDLFSSILGDKVEFIDKLDWSKPEVIIKEIKKFDISVVPLVKDEWNRGKYSLKAIETMSLGIPTVVTDTDGAKNLIKNGQNGFLASNTDEWVGNLVKITDMQPDAYRDMGQLARNTIQSDYSLESNVPRIKEIILNL